MAFFGTKGDDRIWAGVARLTKTSSRSRSLVRSGERAPVVTPPAGAAFTRGRPKPPFSRSCRSRPRRNVNRQSRWHPNAVRACVYTRRPRSSPQPRRELSWAPADVRDGCALAWGFLFARGERRRHSPLSERQRGLCFAQETHIGPGQLGPAIAAHHLHPGGHGRFHARGRPHAGRAAFTSRSPGQEYLAARVDTADRRRPGRNRHQRRGDCATNGAGDGRR